MTKKTVKTLRQWTEPNGTTHNPDEVCEIDIDVPGMDFEEHLLAQGVVEVVSTQTLAAAAQFEAANAQQIAARRKSKSDTTETTSESEES